MTLSEAIVIVHRTMSALKGSSTFTVEEQSALLKLLSFTQQVVLLVESK